MLTALLAALLLAPLYWLLVPALYRRDVVAVASLLVLGAYDSRLVVLILGVALGLHFALHFMAARSRAARWGVATTGFLLLAALFLWNKVLGQGGGALGSQGGLVLLGVSYIVLKAAALLADAAREARGPMRLRDLLGWLAFLPTYPAGPIETEEHFRQQPSAQGSLVQVGLERILFGLVKAVVFSHALSQWAQPMLSRPDEVSRLWLLLATYAATLRFYLDFAGYSDIAIGLAAVYGYRIDENFDRPLIRRNLVQLWRHWHMTLTRWLRSYLFMPLSRGIMRRGGPRFDTVALVVAQVVTMTFCGLWHGLSWNFGLWGLAQALGLVWVGIAARPLGQFLPVVWLRWWRRSPVAHGLSVLLTFNAFSLSNVLVYSNLEQALRVFGRLFSCAG